MGCEWGQRNATEAKKNCSRFWIAVNADLLHIAQDQG